MSPLFRNTAALLGIALGIFCSQPSQAANAKPKYGPEATPLSRSHEYLRKSDAPDFWALIPYYAAQQDERSCSVASVATVVNGARFQLNLGSEDELATQRGLLKRVKGGSWSRSVGPMGRGVELDRLGPILEESLRAYGVDGARAEVVHIENASSETLARLRDVLAANEKSSTDFIVANFDQKVFTGDAQVGHIAPVGAYDAKNDRVLILDPDRQWYEPYWVSVETFAKGMATRDSTAKKSRGYVHVRTGPKE